MGRVTTRRGAAHLTATADGALLTQRPETLVVEEPLEIRLNGTPLTVTMRTPGSDVELAQGFLLTEGVIGGRTDVLTVRYCRSAVAHRGANPDGLNTYNVLDVSLTDPGAARAVIAPRAFVTSSACGVCGTSSIEALQRTTRYELQDFPVFDPAMITTLPDQLRSQQQVFRSTGGIHAAALVRPDGTVERVREDVGRHNAMDKVIGSALLAVELPISDRALLTSSRASFELVQKAVMAGVGMLIAVSAPSSLAVQLATATGLTLVGFTSPQGFNIYSGAQRIAGAKA